MGRENSRRDLVFGWARRDPDHEAAIRFDGEAPGRRAHSSVGIAAMGSLRVTATSDRDQRPATRARPVTEIVLSAGPAVNAGDHCRHQPVCSAHFDHHDQRAILIKGGERTAQGHRQVSRERAWWSRVGQVNGRDDDASRPNLRRLSIPC